MNGAGLKLIKEFMFLFWEMLICKFSTKLLSFFNPNVLLAW
jgi:hypothetical protein